MLLELSLQCLLNEFSRVLIKCFNFFVVVVVVFYCTQYNDLCGLFGTTFWWGLVSCGFHSFNLHCSNIFSIWFRDFLLKGVSEETKILKYCSASLCSIADGYCCLNIIESSITKILIRELN